MRLRSRFLNTGFLGSRFLARSAALVFAAGLAGLTCDDAPPTEPLAEQFAKAFCEHQFDCCSPYELSLITSDRYKSQDGCLTFATLAARQQLGAVEGALATGRISVDASRLEACMKAYAGQSCNAFTTYPGAVSPIPNVGLALTYCPDLLVGHVPPNQPCSLSLECAKGSRCVTGVPDPISAYPGQPTPVPLVPVPGVCVPYQKTGEPCNDSTDCGDDGSCRAPEFVCGAPAAEGAPCTSTLNQNTGQVTSNCDEKAGLFCEDAITFTCRHHPRAGEPCDFARSPQCDPDPALALSCDFMFSGTCRAPGDEGDACGGPAIPPCRPAFSCHATQTDGIGTCGALPRLGETCTDRCASPGVCASGSCTMPGKASIGAACTTDGDCASLSCTGFLGGHFICAANSITPTCIGAGVTYGSISGFGGIGGNGGFGGTVFTGRAGTSGFAGSVSTGGRAGGAAGTAGVGGTSSGGAGGMAPLGCPFSATAPENPIIADFTVADGATTFPIGGIYSYTAPMSADGPTATITSGALHVTAATVGRETPQFWGAGIFFNIGPAETTCVDASMSSGVEFDVSGTLEGVGCTLQYATNDSAHTDNLVDPKGSGPPGAFAPQQPFSVTPTVRTIRVPFTGPGGPLGGSPAIDVNSARLTSVQWQLTTNAGVDNTCAVDLTIDNVRFF
jgi:hypothetical protein